MRGTQAKKLRKAIAITLNANKITPEKYAEIFHNIYKQAKKEFNNTPWNEKSIVRIN